MPLWPGYGAGVIDSISLHAKVARAILPRWLVRPRSAARSPRALVANDAISHPEARPPGHKFQFLKEGHEMNDTTRPDANPPTSTTPPATPPLAKPPEAKNAMDMSPEEYKAARSRLARGI